MSTDLEARPADAETREVYEWTVLKKEPVATRTDDEFRPGYIEAGVIESPYGSIIGWDEAAKIGELAGAGEYLCVRENRCESLTIVAETVYRKVGP